MTLPQLDVDYHLAPFVDERDHCGIAQARVQIGAPHFEKTRDFWVRPVRWTGIEKTGHYFLIRPVEAKTDQLFLAHRSAHYSHDLDGDALPPSWEEGALVDRKTKVKSHLNNLLRYWRHPVLPLAACYSFYFGEDQNEHQYAPSLYALKGNDTREFLYSTEFGDPLTLSSDQWIDWPTQEYHSLISDQFDDPQSEIYLTWQWIQIPREEWLATYVSRPEWSGFMGLMRFVLINEFSHNKKLSRQKLRVHWNCKRRTLQTDKVHKWVNGSIALGNSAQDSFEYSQRLDGWSKALRNHYEGLPTQTPAPRFVNTYVFLMYPISCSAPSHHEMLEARLQLHAWAREHLPGERAQTLIALDDLN